MGPKKAKGKQETTIGGYGIDQMTEDELRVYAQKVQEETVRTQEEIERFQTEKSSVEVTWEASKRQLISRSKQLDAKKLELEDIRVSSEKILDEMDLKLEYVEREDLQNLMREMIEFSLVQLQNEKNDLKIERNASERVKQKERERQNLEGAYEKVLQSVRQTRCEDVSRLIQYHERKLNQTAVKYEHTYEALWEVINKQRLAQLQDAEDSRAEQIGEVDQRRTKKFQHIREYFGRISFDCLALIGDLKGELEDAKKRVKDEKTQLRIQTAKFRHFETLRSEVDEAREVLQFYADDKKKFARNRKKMLEHIQYIKDLELENHMLSAKLQSATQQRSSLEAQFLTATKRLQQSSSLKNVYSEKRLRALMKLLKQKEQEKIRASPQVRETNVQRRLERRSDVFESTSSDHSVNVVNLVFRERMVRFKPPVFKDE